MIFSILTKGWILRIFIVLLWLIALLGRVFTEEKFDFIAVFIGFANCFLYLTVSTRLVLLTHSPMAAILPDYFEQLKKSLVIVFLVSLIPTLILMPNVIMWLSLLSILITMTVVFVAITYQPKFYLAFLLLMFMPYSVEKFPTLFTEVNFPLLFALSLPFTAWWAYRLLNNLESYKGNAEHIQKFIALTSLNFKNAVTSQDDIPLKSRNRFAQWLINNNFAHFRTFIRSKKNMSNIQLVTVACQNVGSIGRSTYLFWGAAVVFFSLVGHYLGEEYQGFFIPMTIIFPAIMIGVGTLNLFQVINNKKSLLKRLSIMPCFHEKHSFSLAFITYVISNQIKLYTFISLVIAILTYAFHHLTLSMYINVLSVSLTLCIFNLTLMLWSWSSKHYLDNQVTWLMIIIFVVLTVFLIVTTNNNIVIWNNSTFIISVLLCIGLFGISFYRSYTNGIQEL